MTYKISATGKIPEALLKEMNTWGNLYAEKPQVEFEDPAVTDRVKEFNKQVQVSTALLLKVQEAKDKYKPVLSSFSMEALPTSVWECMDSCQQSFFRSETCAYSNYNVFKSVFCRHFADLETNEQELAEKIRGLRDKDKSSYTLLDWIANKNSCIEVIISSLNLCSINLNEWHGRELNPVHRYGPVICN